MHSELDAFLDLALLEELAADDCGLDEHATASFFEVARGCVPRFAEALEAGGVVSELPALRAPAGGPATRLALIAPSDAAMAAAPAALADKAVLRAHVAVLDGGLDSGVLRSLDGQAYIAQSLFSPQLAQARVGNARVLDLHAFAHGVVVVVDAVLFTLQLQAESRPEQVWQKAVIPSPELRVVGTPAGQHVEVHAQLVHLATGEAMPEEALRGGLGRLSATAAGLDVAFRDLVRPSAECPSPPRGHPSPPHRLAPYGR